MSTFWKGRQNARANSPSFSPLDIEIWTHTLPLLHIVFPGAENTPGRVGHLMACEKLPWLGSWEVPSGPSVYHRPGLFTVLMTISLFLGQTLWSDLLSRYWVCEALCIHTPHGLGLVGNYGLPPWTTHVNPTDRAHLKSLFVAIYTKEALNSKSCKNIGIASLSREPVVLRTDHWRAKRHALILALGQAWITV